MNRRSLFKGLAAIAVSVPFGVKTYASGGYSTGESGPELHLPSANVGVIRAGRLTSWDGEFSIDLSAGRIAIVE